jgi:hypothetical protein
MPLIEVKTNNKDSYYEQTEQMLKDLHKHRIQTLSCYLKAQGCKQGILKPKI